MKKDNKPESIVNFEPWVIGLIAAIMIFLAMYFDRRQAQNERDIAGIYNRLNVEISEKEARK